ncbi:hypothetical protein [Kitasatospora sp. NPDC057223]|uniref:hypothetical protein n=1 Tax=Kitasatospora sp. NPDC057223 TaxID=3346055 RepID=UPI003643E8BF
MNGFLFGRYWEVGPQVTLDVPAPLLVPGANTVTVAERERVGDCVEPRSGPGLGLCGEYIELSS